MARKASGKRGWAWGRVWPWLTVLAVYAVIYWFSAQPGEISDAQSLRVENLLGHSADWFSVLVRKSAHVALYLVLGAAACFAWLREGEMPRRRRFAVLRAAALCALLAGLDELHQDFVAERAALMSDVLLDTASSALAALGVAGVDWLWARRRGGRTET